MASLPAPKLATQQKAKEGAKLVRMVRHNSSKEQQAWIDYAFARCGKDCVLTFTGESGWRMDAVNTNKNGSKDYSLCQVNSTYHSKFIKSKEFKDPYKVLDYCIGIWHDGIKKGRIKTTFYAYAVRNTNGILKQFEFVY